MAKYTPMIEQYLKVKAENQDSILLFRLGDFYEMFFDDARTASKELEIVLTARDGGCEKIPMCGVPYHSVNNYIARLINKGYKVAICDQVEDPKTAVGIVKREITKIITPGTIMDEAMLDEGKNNYLAAVVKQHDIIGLSCIDISTGDFWVTEFQGSDAEARLDNELQRLMPAECLLAFGDEMNSLWIDNPVNRSMFVSRVDEPLCTLPEARQKLQRHFGVSSLEGYGLKECSSSIIAAALIMDFLDHNYKSRLQHIQSISFHNTAGYMDLDSCTRKNLELTATIREGRKEGTLLGVLDHCRTPMGKRLLRKWLNEPLLDDKQINNRLDAVQELFNDLNLRRSCREFLGKISDLERLAGKLGSNTANPRDLLAIKNSAAMLPEIKSLLKDCASSLLTGISRLDTLDNVFHIINEAIVEDAPLSIKEGGIIKPGYNADIDELKSLGSQGKSWLIDFENREKERTGIKFLKVGFNKVFGYYIEISKSNLGLVPGNYIRKQTLVNTERFITEELKIYEDKILTAQERLFDLEYRCFQEICDCLRSYIAGIQDSARAVASLDVLVSFAHVAYHNDYVRPQITGDGRIDIKGGRHPVVELAMPDARFVPNDVSLDMQGHRFAIITGPNMGGKSTYMRQVAVMVIMTQMGSFIPADEAHISLVDRIFTRVGASDDLASGQSTFMVEMLELAMILNSATRHSLIILDEIGRGTSTYDGLSIAQAASEYLHDKIEAKTLFATHYHELTRMADSKPGVFNLSVSVLESGDTVTFLKKVLHGRADKSYGIHVARLAGVPHNVIQRAYEILEGLERQHRETMQTKTTMAQPSLFAEDNHVILQELSQTNIDSLTPKEALLLLYRWKEMQ